jgi:hypothetical protein
MVWLGLLLVKGNPSLQAQIVKIFVTPLLVAIASRGSLPGVAEVQKDDGVLHQFM